MTIYGYARCSTNETKQDITRQIRELKALGATEIYKEYASGTKTNREELTRLLGNVNSGDTIISIEVSRITRSTKHLCEIIDFAKDKHLKLIFGSLVIDCTQESINPVTMAMLQLMAVVSELEKNMISERTKSGMANARAKGVKLGRPKTTVGNIPKSFIEPLELVQTGTISKSQCARMLQCSRTTIDKYLALLSI